MLCRNDRKVKARHKNIQLYQTVELMVERGDKSLRRR
jgi:hypothetical protein